LMPLGADGTCKLTSKRTLSTNLFLLTYFHY
jgi:hypothetical protein